jgi:DNA polymerase-1
LIDGLSLRSERSARPTDLSTPNGTITSTVYDFTSMLVKVLADGSRPRSRWASARRAEPSATISIPTTRAPARAPDIFVPQLPLIHEVIDTLMIPTLEVEAWRPAT